MISECFCGITKQRGKVWNFVWWRRVFGAAPALKDVASFDLLSKKVSSFARNPHHLFGALIVRLQIGIGNAPVLDRVVFR